jgi:hypothetical protein
LLLSSECLNQILKSKVVVLRFGLLLLLGKRLSGLGGGSLGITRLVHTYFALRMLVDANADLVTIEVVNRVEMTEERITNQEEILVLARKSALVDDKEALFIVRFIEVLLRVDLEDVVAHLEADGLDFGCHLLARLSDMAESLVGLAVELGERSGPLNTDLLEHIWRNGQLATASVDNGGVRSVLTRLLHGS